jgi:hypothetical protein
MMNFLSGWSSFAVKIRGEEMWRAWGLEEKEGEKLYMRHVTCRDSPLRHSGDSLIHSVLGIASGVRLRGNNIGQFMRF